MSAQRGPLTWRGRLHHLRLRRGLHVRGRLVRRPAPQAGVAHGGAHLGVLLGVDVIVGRVTPPGVQTQGGRPGLTRGQHAHAP